MVTAEHVSDFARDGAVCIRGALTDAEIDLARRAIDANLVDLSPGAKRASGADDGAFIEDFCSWQRISELTEFIRTSSAACIAGQLMASRRVRFFHDHVLVKEPGTAQRTPWH
ncbi:MAG: phytanoyl-CoA dioxygenase family protein, partial [Ilumatobacteraceae bacterium]